MTFEEIKNRMAYDLVQEVSERQEPLIVTLEDGTAFIVQPVEELRTEVHG